MTEKLTYAYIKKHLGDKWLKNQFELAGKSKLIVPLHKDAITRLVEYSMGIVDQLISRNETIEGFDSWVKEAKRSNAFEDCFFELICFDELFKFNDVIIKSKNIKNIDKTPDAFLKNEDIYVEMTNLGGVPSSIGLKANELCEKSQERFSGSLGVHFIGTSLDFQEYSKKHNKFLRKEALDSLVKLLISNLSKLDKNILGFVLFHNYLNWNPKTNMFTLHCEISDIIANGVVNEGLLKKLLEMLEDYTGESRLL